jgi:aminoglycoside/choline kinase family phosphotransferase
MTNRDIEIQEFLTRSSWDHAVRSPLAADASNRSYDRLSDPKTSARAILMNAPPLTNEPVSTFNDIAQRLLNANLSAPKIFASSPDTGLMLIEDLGDNLFARLAADNPDTEATIYKAAIDALCHLHKNGNALGLPRYSDDIYRKEAALITDWYLPAIHGYPTDSDKEKIYTDLVSRACNILSGPDVLVMRDYHAENLLWLPERSGVGKVGLLDFQDALVGNWAYDLVSLLEDARRDTSLCLQTEMKAHYIQKMGIEASAFERDYAILGAQRNLKIIGIFSRLCIRDKKPSYVDLIPRVWGHLQNDLAHPELSSLREWIRTNVPTPTSEILAIIKSTSLDD